MRRFERRWYISSFFQYASSLNEQAAVDGLVKTLLRLDGVCGAANCLAQCLGGARLTDIDRLKTDIRVRKLAEM